MYIYACVHIRIPQTHYAADVVHYAGCPEGSELNMIHFTLATCIT